MGNTQKPARPINRNGYWYLVRRVPKHLVQLERRRTVLWSTGIPVWQDPSAVRARVLVGEYDAKLQEYWRALLAGADSPRPHLHEANMKRAAELQIPYLTNEELCALPLNVLYQRFALLIAAHGEKALTELPHTPAMRADLAAVLGGTRLTVE